MTEDDYVEMKVRELQSSMVDLSVAFFQICTLFELDLNEISKRATLKIAEQKIHRLKCDGDGCGVCKTTEGKN